MKKIYPFPRIEGVSRNLHAVIAYNVKISQRRKWYPTNQSAIFNFPVTDQWNNLDHIWNFKFAFSLVASITMTKCKPKLQTYPYNFERTWEESRRFWKTYLLKVDGAPSPARIRRVLINHENECHSFNWR